jgi:hypothetical protein
MSQRAPHKPTRPGRFLRVAPKTFPLPVRSHAMNVDQWLRQVAAYRKQLPVEERLEALLWSWPIRRALTTAPSRFSWNCAHDDEDVLDRKHRTLHKLESLASTWYPFGPPTLSDPSFEKRCTDLCDDLFDLAVISEPLRGPETAVFLATFIEQHWGDGQFEWRQDQQDILLFGTYRFDVPTLQRICTIAEQARDTAYLSVRTTTLLAAMRNTKTDLKKVATWVKKMPDVGILDESFRAVAQTVDPMQLPTLEFLFREDLAAIADAFQGFTAHKRNMLHYLQEREKELAVEDRALRLPTLGHPIRPWVQQAHQGLKRLHIESNDRRELLQFWGLVPHGSP